MSQFDGDQLRGTLLGDPQQSPQHWWGDLPYAVWEAREFAAWLDDFRYWASETGYEWNHGEQLVEALAIWRAEQDSAAAAANRAREAEQARQAQAAIDREAAARAAQAEREAASRAAEAAAREALMSLVADDAQRTADDPGSLRAVVAWLRTSDVKITVTDSVAQAVLKAAGTQLTADIKARQQEIADARRQFDAERLVRLATGQPPVAIPAPINISRYVNPDAVARWLVFHEGQYTLTVGSWQTQEIRDQDGAVTGTRRVLKQLDDWSDIETRCKWWATWRRFADEAEQRPEEAERLRAVGLDVLRGDPAYHELVAEQDGSWTFEPNHEAYMAKKEPVTKTRGGRPALPDDKLARKIERKVKRFWYEHRRGPTRNELADAVGGTRARVLQMIADMVAASELMEGGERAGLWVDG